MDHQQQDQRRRMHKRVVPADPGVPGAPGAGSTATTPGATSSVETTPKASTTSPTSSSTPVTPTSKTTTSSAAVNTTKASSTTTPSTSSTASTGTGSSTASTTSTTSISSASSSTGTTNNVPTTMSHATTASVGNPLSQTTDGGSLTNPSMPTETINGNTGNSGNVATKSMSTGGIIAIVVGAFIAVGAISIFTCWVRRRLRPRRDRHRNSFMRGSIAIPDDIDAGPVIGTRNALALARANMGHEQQPEMTETNHQSAAQWGAYDNNQSHAYPPYDQYNQEYAQHQHGYEGHDQYNQYDHQQQYGEHQQYDQNGHQFSDLARQLDVPAVALTPAYADEKERYDSHTAQSHSPTPGYNADQYGRNSPPNGALGRQLSTSAYGSLSAHSPTPQYPTRTGTPVDSNPQQAYIAPHDRHNGEHDEDDAYGGI